MLRDHDLRCGHGFSGGRLLHRKFVRIEIRHYEIGTGEEMDEGLRGNDLSGEETGER